VAGSRDEALALGCEGCHDAIHFDDLDNPRSNAEKTRVLSESKTGIPFLRRSMTSQQRQQNTIILRVARSSERCGNVSTTVNDAWPS